MMPDKLVPDKDRLFADTSRAFVTVIEQDPARFFVTAEDAQCIRAAVNEFHEALTIAMRKSTRTTITIMTKNEARRKAEAIVRKYSNFIRANPKISTSDKLALRINERPKRLKRRPCPASRPVLKFLGVAPDGKHLLHFCEVLGGGKRRKPDGAVRVELFVDLVPPGEQIPKHPAELTGRPWYQRSFTKNPIEAAFPVPSMPMLIVYWARWADSMGNISRYSETCIARVEGWTPKALPENTPVRRVEAKYVIMQAPYQLPASIEADEVVVADGQRDVSRQLEPATWTAIELAG